MLQILSIALAQVEGDRTEHVLNKTRQIVYSSNWAKEITQKVYNNVINLIQI